MKRFITFAASGPCRGLGRFDATVRGYVGCTSAVPPDLRRAANGVNITAIPCRRNSRIGSVHGPDLKDIEERGCTRLRGIRYGRIGQLVAATGMSGPVKVESDILFQSA